MAPNKNTNIKISFDQPSGRARLSKMFKHRFLNYFTLFYTTLIAILITLVHNELTSFAQEISKPSEFDRLIMPCYLGGGGGGGGGGLSPLSSTYGLPPQQPDSLAQNPAASPPVSPYGVGSPNNSPYSSQLGRSNPNGLPNGNGGAYQPTYFASSSSSAASSGTGNSFMNQPRNGLSNLGQQVPRASTMDNFIALLTKIEAANPRLASNPDQLIRALLGRFRMDNYYYDVRTRTPIGEQDHRREIIQAILNPMGLNQQQQIPQPYLIQSDVFPEQLLNHDEKCSMYFMLSHFIDKTSPLNQPLANIPVSQLGIGSAPNSQRPPALQAAGSGYPSQSANNAFSGTSGSRYPGPSPSFGSPATSNMNSFGAGISNNPDYTGNNPYGTNVLQANNQFNQNYNNLRNAGQYAGTITSNSKYSTPFIDGQARSRDERQALEYGVVTVANQENAALVLNRVLMGILAAATPIQTVRQLASVIYPTQTAPSSSRIDEELDPLFAVTLADLWAISSIPKPGKTFDIRLLGDNGHWNGTMCPTSFVLDRASSITFTTAELIGGLDGFNLGMFRRRLMSLRKNMRLSEMLKMYYSKNGFRPQFAEVGVCNRASGINTQLDDLRRQAESYLRLYQLNLPISDNEIANSINRLDSFKELSRQSANQYTPMELCQESSFNEPYPIGQQDQCEISKADVSIVLDTSAQANDEFMNLVAVKLASKLGLSRQGNSLSIFTNQQDSTGYAGAYSFNAIVRNSTNTAEIGCSLTYDTTRSYQGGQITDPTRLFEMFERALITLDSEYLIRQTQSQTNSYSSTYKQSSYVSSLFGQSDGSYYMNGVSPRNTGGAKVIIWFNYGQPQRQAPAGSSPTNWYNSPGYADNQYKFQEAKRYLRENFRGASILAVSNNRDDSKAFVYDEEKDIFTDIPPGSGSSSSSMSDYYPTSALDPSSSNAAALSGPAEQLINKLLLRMCDIPAVFQYPMCFKAPSDNAISVGYISPGRKQYWMMSPKTFFASRSVRMIFKADGGRLRICFGRMPRPDESAQKYGREYQSNGISLGGSSSSGSDNNAALSSGQSSSDDYYTGLRYGVCKDVSSGQEIDFMVEEPCYKKSIAECEPFYYVIKEISNPGEVDPNYMCKDEGCKRFDQAKFTMSHTGVICSSAFRAAKANWLLIILSIGFSIVMTAWPRDQKHKARS